MLKRSAKLPKGFDQAKGILGRIVYPHIEIFGVAGLPVFHDCEAADDQKLNLEFV